MPFTLRNIKEDLEDVGSKFDGAPDLEFCLATQALELEQSGLSYQRGPTRLPLSIRPHAQAGGAGSASAVIDAKPLALLRSLPKGSRFYPSQVTGSVSGLGAGRPVAIAVNGRIAGSSTTIDSAGAIRFSILVPEERLHMGRNPVRLFAVNRTATGITLAQLALA